MIVGDNGFGYLRVKLGKSCYQIQRLIALTFLGSSGDLEVNHKDGNKYNNSLSNLEYVTPSENIRHAFKLGLRKIQLGTDANASKFSEEDIEKIFELSASGFGVCKIAKLLSVNRHSVSRLLSGKTYKNRRNK